MGELGELSSSITGVNSENIGGVSFEVAKNERPKKFEWMKPEQKKELEAKLLVIYEEWRRVRQQSGGALPVFNVQFIRSQPNGNDVANTIFNYINDVHNFSPHSKDGKRKIIRFEDFLPNPEMYENWINPEAKIWTWESAIHAINGLYHDWQIHFKSPPHRHDVYFDLYEIELDDPYLARFLKQEMKRRKAKWASVLGEGSRQSDWAGDGYDRAMERDLGYLFLVEIARYLRLREQDYKEPFFNTYFAYRHPEIYRLLINSPDDWRRMLRDEDIEDLRAVGEELPSGPKAKKKERGPQFEYMSPERQKELGLTLRHIYEEWREQYRLEPAKTGQFNSAYIKQHPQGKILNTVDQYFSDQFEFTEKYGHTKPNFYEVGRLEDLFPDPEMLQNWENPEPEVWTIEKAKVELELQFVSWRDHDTKLQDSTGFSVVGVEWNAPYLARYLHEKFKSTASWRWRELMSDEAQKAWRGEEYEKLLENDIRLFMYSEIDSYKTLRRGRDTSYDKPFFTEYFYYRHPNLYRYILDKAYPRSGSWVELIDPEDVKILQEFDQSLDIVDPEPEKAKRNEFKFLEPQQINEFKKALTEIYEDWKELYRQGEIKASFNDDFIAKHPKGTFHKTLAKYLADYDKAVTTRRMKRRDDQPSHYEDFFTNLEMVENYYKNTPKVWDVESARKEIQHIYEIWSRSDKDRSHNLDIGFGPLYVEISEPYLAKYVMEQLNLDPQLTWYDFLSPLGQQVWEGDKSYRVMFRKDLKMLLAFEIDNYKKTREDHGYKGAFLTDYFLYRHSEVYRRVLKTKAYKDDTWERFLGSEDQEYIKSLGESLAFVEPEDIPGHEQLFELMPPERLQNFKDVIFEIYNDWKEQIRKNATTAVFDESYIEKHRKGRVMALIEGYWTAYDAARAKGDVPEDKTTGRFIENYLSNAEMIENWANPKPSVWNPKTAKESVRQLYEFWSRDEKAGGVAFDRFELEASEPLLVRYIEDLIRESPALTWKSFIPEEAQADWKGEEYDLAKKDLKALFFIEVSLYFHLRDRLYSAPFFTDFFAYRHPKLYEELVAEGLKESNGADRTPAWVARLNPSDIDKLAKVGESIRLPEPESPEQSLDSEFTELKDRLDKFLTEVTYDVVSGERGPIWVELSEPYLAIDIRKYMVKAQLQGKYLDWSDFLTEKNKRDWNNIQVWTAELIGRAIDIEYNSFSSELVYGEKIDGEPFFTSYFYNTHPEAYQAAMLIAHARKLRGEKTDWGFFLLADRAETPVIKSKLDLEIVPCTEPMPWDKEVWDGDTFRDKHWPEVIDIRQKLEAAYYEMRRQNLIKTKVKFGRVDIATYYAPLADQIDKLINKSQRCDKPLTWEDFIDDYWVKQSWDPNQAWNKYNISMILEIAWEDIAKDKGKRKRSFRKELKESYPTLYFHVLELARKGWAQKRRVMVWPDFLVESPKAGSVFNRDVVLARKQMLASGQEMTVLQDVDFSRGKPLRAALRGRTETAPADTKETNQQPIEGIGMARQKISGLFELWQSTFREKGKAFAPKYILEQDAQVYTYVRAQVTASAEARYPLTWLDFIPDEAFDIWPSNHDKRAYVKKREEELDELLLQAAKVDDDEGQTTAQLNDIREILGLFGGANGAEVLVRYLPDYQRVPVERVRGMLAEHLGNFLVNTTVLNLEVAKRAEPLLDSTTLQQRLTDVMKQECLDRFVVRYKQRDGKSEEELINAVCQDLRSEVEAKNSAILLRLADDVVEYYTALYRDLHKPDSVIDEYKPGRQFPDLFQRINTKEILDKHRVLIADGMGVGKSASAILAKEMAGAKTALCLVPSNVLNTWDGYLSDRKKPDGSPHGYFKTGQVPKVLKVESLADLRTKVQNDEISGYDYILLSHERLDEEHMKELRETPFDFLIIDEVHKLKNIEKGTRSAMAIELAQINEQRNGYLVPMSGTPVPNKIEDVAVLLKLLYPERFAQTENSKLVSSIINSDIIDLRSLLLQRMQMKRLEDVEGMPELTEEMVHVRLDDEEMELYRAVMDDEEVKVSQKLTMLRKLVLNPPTQEKGSKLRHVERELQSFFANRDRCFMPINGYIEEVMVGQRSIDKLLDLPADVEIVLIHGGTSKAERDRIQDRFQSRQHRMLVLASGQTADVGVDFSAAEGVFFYNEPWTKADYLQQRGRAYRPGLTNPLTVKTFITEDTIEEGIHTYIEAKERAVQKLLRGIPVDSTERELLMKDEKRSGENLENNSELAEYYYSKWDKMRRIFAYVKEIGEESFKEFLQVYGEEYASCYTDLGDKGYQANANRILGNLIERQMKERGQAADQVRILDVGSGPEMLRRHINQELARRVYSMDYNFHHFKERQGEAVAGSITALPFAHDSMDYINMNFVLHYTDFAPTKGVTERAMALVEANHALKVGGRLMLNMIHTLRLRNPVVFKEMVEALGFRIVPDISGAIEVGNNYRSDLVVLEKVTDAPGKIVVGPDGAPPDPHQREAEIMKILNQRQTSAGIGLDSAPLKLIEGLRFQAVKKSQLQNARIIPDRFKLGNREFALGLNLRDKALFEEEVSIRHIGLGLKKRYGSIEEIPANVLNQSGFIRYNNGQHWTLFRKLQIGAGSVVIH
jgi:superfamily II DNA or RNA helicase